MKLTDTIDIMLECCIPDKKKLMTELSKLSPGQTLEVKIDDCVASKAMVQSFLQNKWYRIVETEDRDGSSILRIGVEKELTGM